MRLKDAVGSCGTALRNRASDSRHAQMEGQGGLQASDPHLHVGIGQDAVVQLRAVSVHLLAQAGGGGARLACSSAPDDAVGQQG